MDTTKHRNEPRHEAAVATAMGHAGEILQGVVESEGGLHRVLVSLLAPTLEARAVIRRSAHSGLRVFPAWKQKSLRAAELAFRALGKPHPGGVIEIQSNIPIGHGLGSSTSDCVAAIRAVAQSCGQRLLPEEIGQIAQLAEGSSDSTMFDDCLVAFFHCEGRVHRRFNGQMPAFRMLVVEPASKDLRVDTDSFTRPDYLPTEIDCFHRLMEQLDTAIGASRARAIAAVACASAEINQRYLPKPHYDAAMRVAEATDALGVATAHSGTVLALLYNDDIACEHVLAACRLLSEDHLTTHQDLRSFEYSAN